MNKKLLLIPLLVVALLLTACGGKNPDTPDTPDTPDVSTTTSAEATVEGDATTTTAKGDKTTKPASTSKPANNEVNWEDVFGADDDTTTSGKGDKTTKKTTTSTTKKTTTAPTTTMKPTTIDKVTLPAEGTDVDGRGRIKISTVDLKNGVLTISIRNYTDEQKTQWITEETDYVTYACYDKDGKALKGDDDAFGYLYLGCLEEGQEVSFSVALPKGTATVALTGAKITYWTPWS
ncbi:MAG: hypothetical protein IIX28_02455 [Clostridia bacterium]|nr:hypothetical protein [Clostridia bacterium]